MFFVAVAAVWLFLMRSFSLEPLDWDIRPNTSKAHTATRLINKFTRKQNKIYSKQTVL